MSDVGRVLQSCQPVTHSRLNSMSGFLHTQSPPVCPPRSISRLDFSLQHLPQFFFCIPTSVHLKYKGFCLCSEGSVVPHLWFSGSSRTALLVWLMNQWLTRQTITDAFFFLPTYKCSHLNTGLTMRRWPHNSGHWTELPTAELSGQSQPLRQNWLKSTWMTLNKKGEFPTFSLSFSSLWIEWPQTDKSGT